MARLRGRRVVLIQHEWGGLHWARRITYMPALLLADTIVMFSPLVRRELAGDSVVGWTAQKCVLAPLPPNIEAPAGIVDPKLRQRLAAARESGRLVIGHFGSIYPGKQPNALLNIGAILKARGLKPLIVYIGSFIRATDNVEEEFHARAAELGLDRRCHCQRLRRIRSRSIRPVQRDRRLLLCPRRRPHRAALQRADLRAVRAARHRHRPGRGGRIRPSSALQGTDRPRRRRAGAARLRRRRLCRPHRVGAAMAVGACAVRFRRMVARCRGGGAGAAELVPDEARRAASAAWCAEEPGRTTPA